MFIQLSQIVEYLGSGRALDEGRALWKSGFISDVFECESDEAEDMVVVEALCVQSSDIKGTLIPVKITITETS